MSKPWGKTLVLAVLWVTIALAGFGSAVWQLWNQLMPQLFGLPLIGFWQAAGLMALCWLLFGGWRGAGGFAARERRETSSGLTEQERDRFRTLLRRKACE